MLHLFSAEPALENTFSDEQIRTVIHALRREGKAQEVIYHTENKESFRYVITTEMSIDSGKKLLQTTTSVEKFKLQEDEFLEFVQDSLDGGLVREKQYTLPLQEDHDDQACQECLSPVAIKHLRCINKIERLLSAPRPHPVVQKSGSRTTLLLFALLIALLGGSLFTLRPLFTPKQSADLTLLFNTVDVQVWLGAKKYPTTGNRLALNLPLGRYRLRAEKPGFKPLREDIFLTTDEEIGIRLEELYPLTVYADMEGSRVLLDGNIVGTAGTTSPLDLSLIKGEYDLTLMNPAVSTPWQKKIILPGDEIIRADMPHPRLTLQLNVDDALITVGEKAYQVQGRKLALKLPLGPHQLLVRKPGYAPMEQELIIKDQDQDLSINLERIHYQLSLTPNVANSSISVSCQNGQKYFGIASPDNPFHAETSAGSCRILAERQGYQHVSQEVTLTADLELAITLKQLFLVTVYTNLDLSTVLLDGKEAGKAGTRTPAVLSITRGAYTLKISNPQAVAPVQQTLQVNKDQRLKINLPLPQLTVKVNVAGATILVDQEEHQIDGKQLALKLTQGTHQITAQKQGYLSVQREVFVRDGVRTFFELLPPASPLSIRSNIDKTGIYVKCKDGKEYAGLASPKAPFYLEAVAGDCTISASREGYKDVTQTATLPGEKEISVHLVADLQKTTLKPTKKKQQAKSLQTELETKSETKPAPKIVPRPLPPRSTPKPASKSKKQLTRAAQPKPDLLPIKAEKKGCQDELSVGMPELCD